MKGKPKRLHLPRAAQTAAHLLGGTRKTCAFLYKYHTRAFGTWQESQRLEFLNIHTQMKALCSITASPRARRRTHRGSTCLRRQRLPFSEEDEDEREARTLIPSRCSQASALTAPPVTTGMLTLCPSLLPTAELWTAGWKPQDPP